MPDLPPGSPEWSRRVTASKVAAILGVSPFESQRSVWHLMRGDLDRGDASEQQRRGHYLEDAVLSWWSDQHHEYLGVLDRQPTYTLGDWAAATPDAMALSPEDGAVLVEAKSAAKMDDWGLPGTDVIPAYYLVQCYWQMHVSGIHRCYVPVIGPYLRFEEYGPIEYDATIGAELERRCKAFYDSLDGDEAPDLDDSVATYEALRRIHPDIDKGASVDLAASDAREYVEALLDLDRAERRARIAKSRMHEAMGRAQHAMCGGVKIARRQPNKSGVSLVRVAKTTDDIPTEESAA